MSQKTAVKAASALNGPQSKKDRGDMGKKAGTRTTTYEDGIEVIDIADDSSDLSDLSDVDEDEFLHSSSRPRRGQRQIVSSDDEESHTGKIKTKRYGIEDETRVHQPICGKCGRPAETSSRKKKKEDEDLEVELGDLDACPTCSVSWHEVCAPSITALNADTERQCKDCIKEGPLCLVCQKPHDAMVEEPLFRCFRCKFSAHISCIQELYLADVDESGRQFIESGIGSRKFFESEWKCVDCIVWNDHVETILTYRDESEDEPSSGREYYVKFTGWSHRHCTWVTERWLRASEPIKYRAFWKKVQAEVDDAKKSGISSPWPKDLERSLPANALVLDRIIDVRYRDADDSEVIENVKEMRVKWLGLKYDRCTWETPFEIDDPDYQTMLDKFQDFLARDCIGDVPKKAVRTRKWQGEYTSQPKHVIGGALKSYQLEGLNWLLYKWSKGTSSLLADDMGLGKTVQIVSVLACLHGDYKQGPFLIAAPSSTLGHWISELARWAPQLVVVSYGGDAASREVVRECEIFGNPDTSRDEGKNVRFHVLLSSYETLSRDSAFFRKIKFDVLACDEGHRLKSDAAKTFQAFKKNLNAAHRIILTGTPLQNNVRELFNLLNFLDPVRFSDPQKYEDQYGTDTMTDEMVKEMHEKLAPYFLRRTKDTANLGLPPKVEILVPVSMTSMQTDLYKAVLGRSAALLRQIGVTASGKEEVRVSNLRNILMELRKICNHPYIGKLALLHKMIPKLRAAKHRLLIFSQFKMTLDILQDYLVAEGHTFCRMDGDTEMVHRQPIIEAFNDRDSGAFVFLLTTRTGAEGINLTAADTIIIFDADWNPHRDIQAMARAHRIGQDKPLVVYRFFTRKCVEEKVLEAGKKKLVLDHLLIESMGGKQDSSVDLTDIIKYGAKALFEQDETALENSQIKYDDAEVDKLLDRSIIFAEKDVSVTESQPEAFKLGAFAKLWQADKPDITDAESPDVADPDTANAEELWDKLLKYNLEKEAEARKKSAIEYDEHGRAKRKRKNVDYGGVLKGKKVKISVELSSDDEQPVAPSKSVGDDPEFRPEEADDDEEEDDERSKADEFEEAAILQQPENLKPGSLPKAQRKKRYVNTLSTNQPQSAYRHAGPVVSNSQSSLGIAAGGVPAPLTHGSSAHPSAVSIFRAYASTFNKPQCWLCFQPVVHMITECPSRVDTPYLLEAFNQMALAVREIPMESHIYDEFVGKMKITSMFLSRKGICAPSPIPIFPNEDALARLARAGPNQQHIPVSHASRMQLYPGTGHAPNFPAPGAVRPGPSSQTMPTSGGHEAEWRPSIPTGPVIPSPIDLTDDPEPPRRAATENTSGTTSAVAPIAATAATQSVQTTTTSTGANNLSALSTLGVSAALPLPSSSTHLAKPTSTVSAVSPVQVVPSVLPLASGGAIHNNATSLAEKHQSAARDPQRDSGRPPIVIAPGQPTSHDASSSVRSVAHQNVGSRGHPPAQLPVQQLPAQHNGAPFTAANMAPHPSQQAPVLASSLQSSQYSWQQQMAWNQQRLQLQRIESQQLSSHPMTSQQAHFAQQHTATVQPQMVQQFAPQRQVAPQVQNVQSVHHMQTSLPMQNAQRVQDVHGHSQNRGLAMSYPYPPQQQHQQAYGPGWNPNLMHAQGPMPGPQYGNAGHSGMMAPGPMPQNAMYLRPVEATPTPLCLMCGQTTHLTRDLFCPLLTNHPLEYRTRLYDLMRTGEIDHLSLAEIKAMETNATMRIAPAKQSRKALRSGRTVQLAPAILAPAAVGRQAGRNGANDGNLLVSAAISSPVTVASSVTAGNPGPRNFHQSPAMTGH
ncbi:hypothetical protein HKX48_009063, partial [Thoreauomyces humboldtii]